MLRSLKLAGFAGLVAMAGQAVAEEKFITIGTGGQTGVYYVVGQSICRLVNRGSADHGLKCTAPSTGGSIANINAIKAGDMDMGVAQSDWQYHAYNGSSKFEGNQVSNLRAVFSVHPEPFNLIAASGSGIESFGDLAGKRVNVGNPGSGQRGTFEVILEADANMSMDSFALASQLKSNEQAQALCDNKIDAFGFTVGHPNGSLQEAFSSCGPHFVPLTGEPFDSLVNDNPFYSFATIPAGMYPGQDTDVTTFGVRATFVTSADVDEDTIYNVVKAVFDNFDRFKKLHPAFANLKEEEMISAALSAPLHPGAAKYYKERGWM